MTQEQIDRVFEQLEEYKNQLEPFNRAEEEFVDAIIEYFKDNTDSIIDEGTSLEDIFEELREQQSYLDGGYKEDMFPDVDEDDEEYPDGYNPYNNEIYHLHSRILKQLQEYLSVEE
ncbi:MAG: hypothetical protein IJ814_01425 [Paludibacteraceae bacterium]|nr:hypothetical protein [Paludibacteraceae bacterium]